MLTDAQRASFERDGWLVIRGVLDPSHVERLRAEVDVASRWAEVEGPGMHHFEQTEHGRRIARSEDLLPHHPDLAAFICGDPMLRAVGALFGERAVLFKEKVNYKHPGGAGFAPHQDAAAYRFVDHHISCMVPLDAATEASGCLWVAPGYAAGMLDRDARGCIAAEVVASLAWQPVEVHPGDLLFFDSYTPHKSGTNASDHARRALYLTYNAASKGDHRDRYYADKRGEFDREGGTFGGDRVRISVTGDFLGRPAEAPDLEDLFKRYEGERAHQLYDERVTELAHGLQCGELALAEGAAPAVVAAALLHDVGHLLIGDLFPIDEPLPKDFVHEEVGARYLARWFGPEVTEPVAMHVAAKRYLVATDPTYSATLSPSSVRSLAVQGGPMDTAEIAAFESKPGWRDALALRRWDDLAKVPDAPTRPFQDFHPLLRELSERATR